MVHFELETKKAFRPFTDSVNDSFRFAVENVVDKTLV